MTLNIYKSFDSSEFLFEQIWKLFPTIVSRKNNNKILHELIVSSTNFCELKAKHYFSLKYINEGSFGAVGLIGVNKNPLKAAIFSFDRNGENSLFYTKVIIKIGKQRETKIKRLGMSTISISDPLSDMIFGSALGHLFDIGVCPFITKYFGTYLCKNKETSIIIEASDEELLQKLNRNQNNRVNAKQLQNILVQYAYCLYILKIYYGTVHFDTHLRNILLTDLEKDDYMYHSKYMNQVNFIILETGITNVNGLPILVVIKRDRYLLKLIDFGSMLMCFDRSHFSRFKRDLRIHTSEIDLDNIGALPTLNRCLENKSFSNTVDILFTLLNMYEFLVKNIDEYNGSESNISHINVVNNFAIALFGHTISEFIKLNPTFTLQKFPNGEYDIFVRNHSSGLKTGYNDVNYLMKGIINLCDRNTVMTKFPFSETKYHNKMVNLGFFEDFDIRNLNQENSIFLSHNISDYTLMFNRFEQLIKYEKGCDKHDSVYCTIEKLYGNQKSQEILDDRERILEDNDNYRILFRTSSYQLNPTYKDYNSWLNSTAIDRNKINKPIEDVRIILIAIKKYKKVCLSNNTLLVKEKGISFPVGNSATFGKNVEPLGLCINESTLTLYKHYYPSIYNDYLAVLFYERPGQLKLEKYNNFISRHITQKEKILINERDYEEIDTITIPILLNSGYEQYSWAITIGPILVWDNRIVFTEEIMLNMSSPNPIYKNSSNKIFIGKGTGYFGMTDSNELQTQLILVKRKNTFGVMLVEGNGFLSVGIDRVNAAKLCKNLGMEFAVCIGSGFSTNVLVKNQYLSKSPIRTIQGSIISFSF